MSIPEQAATAFSLWTDAIARTAIAALDNVKSVRRIEIVEDDESIFTMRFAPHALSRGLVP